MIPPRDRLIVALDVSTSREAQQIVRALGDSVGLYKVGLQLFTAEGPAVVRELKSSGRKVFLDLKLNDIPHTVASAVKSAASLGVDMLTVHSNGGPAMMKAAVEAARNAAKPPLILAVTVLTSFSEGDLNATGVQEGIARQAMRMASLAREAGCGGVVSSPREAGILRPLLGEEMALVTPGIRPAGSAAGDQVRTAEPLAAIRAGASHLVVGRPITGAPDKKAAAEAILKEISSAYAELTV